MQHALDATAVSLSTLCLLHCLALPLAAAALPIFGAIAEAEWIHWGLVLLAAPIAIVAIAPAFKTPPRPWGVLTLALTGIALLVTGALAPFGEASETWFTVAGGVTLATAHILNWRRAGARHFHAHAAHKTRA